MNGDGNDIVEARPKNLDILEQVSIKETRLQ
jgi:hypothetical protein